jgi:hypothetical protein
VTSDHNPVVMKDVRSTREEALEAQYDEGFIGRVYRTTAVVWAVVAALVFAQFGTAAMVGLSLGTAIAVGSLRLIEVAVRCLLCPGMPTQPKHFTLFFFLKLPLLTVVMAGAVWIVLSGLANVFALVAGVAMVHGVIFLKAVGNLVVAALPAEERRGTWSLAPRTTAASRPPEKPVPHGHPERVPGAWQLAPGD